MAYVQPDPLKPAVLMRRMRPVVTSEVQTVGLDESAPMVRCEVEAERGVLTLSTDAKATLGEPLQWLQNGVPIRGEERPILHLAGLNCGDTDLYRLQRTTKEGTKHSQSVLVVVVPGMPLVNYSTRGHVAPGRPLIAGFVVGRQSGALKNRTYLIRVIGPSLRLQGVRETLARPKGALFRKGQSFQGRLNRDPAILREWQQKVGAFALEEGSGEFVAMVELPPGPYSIVVDSDGPESGEALVEIYQTDK